MQHKTANLLPVLKASIPFLKSHRIIIVDRHHSIYLHFDASHTLVFNPEKNSGLSDMIPNCFALFSCSNSSSSSSKYRSFFYIFIFYFRLLFWNHKAIIATQIPSPKFVPQIVVCGTIPRWRQEISGTTVGFLLI